MSCMKALMAREGNLQLLNEAENQVGRPSGNINYGGEAFSTNNDSRDHADDVKGTGESPERVLPGRLAF